MMVTGCNCLEFFKDTLGFVHERIIVALATLSRTVISKKVGIDSLLRLLSHLLGKVLLELLFKLLVEVELHYHALRRLNGRRGVRYQTLRIIQLRHHVF